MKKPNDDGGEVAGAGGGGSQIIPASAGQLAKPEPRTGDLIAMVLSKAITPDAVGVIERLVALKRDEEDRNAKREFAQAFNALQSEIPVIKAERVVPNKDGSTRYLYAPYEDIMRQATPILRRHGFSLAFSTKVEGARVTAICTLLHAGGHERTNEYAVRIGGGPPGATECQADGAAYTYAQRGALCDCLGITVSGRDNDAREIGAPITPDQAEHLKQRVAETKSDATKFLSVAGATSFETIPTSKYALLDAMLKKKEGLA